MTGPTVVQLQPDEIEPMRSAMRDVQVSIADYHRRTAGFIADPDDYTTPVRSAVAFIQKLNDVMRTELATPDYRILFEARLARGDHGARTIEAFRYVRNVGQHLLHPVVPEPDAVFGNNLGLGFRTSSHWRGVPPDVHVLLHEPTRALKPHYDQLVACRPTLEPLLDACQFFAEICPELVHRDETGEWTGFPLRVQWGTMDRIHPDEPIHTFADRVGSEDALRRWLDARPPGGDFRWIAAKVTTSTDEYLCGLTFRDGVAYLGFSESLAQVEQDIGAGYRYWHGVPTGNLAVAGEITDRTGASFTPVSTTRDVAEWATSAAQGKLGGADYCHWQGPGYWEGAIRRAMDLNVRRGERLNAWYPIWR
ncbi:MAG TPA: hypothetical protein VF230_00925 [Acidimicrobiales bacterium]